MSETESLITFPSLFIFNVLPFNMGKLKTKSCKQRLNKYIECMGEKHQLFISSEEQDEYLTSIGARTRKAKDNKTVSLNFKALKHRFITHFVKTPTKPQRFQYYFASYLLIFFCNPK